MADTGDERRPERELESPYVMSVDRLQTGKLPPELLQKMLAKAPIDDPDVVVGPGVGLDCAVVDAGPKLLVYKSDPITFTAENIGWYCVQINANDIVTTGADPRWFLLTYLLPENQTTAELVEEISDQVHDACRQMGVSVIGGHTEITVGLERPVLVGTMIGEVDRDDLITPRGARAGDRVLLTKGVPIEATAILSRDFESRLTDVLTSDELKKAQNYIYDPGISVFDDARVAVRMGKVTAMHDPTEGGLAAALWELAQASEHTFVIETSNVAVPSLANKVCETFRVNPLGAIASGALLITISSETADAVIEALNNEDIDCTDIGWIEEGPAQVWQTSATGREQLPYPDRDEIVKVYDE